jgi:hypothetical protein
MKPDPTPKQTLLIWNLLFAGEEPKISAARPALPPKERTHLAEAGLIRLEKRGRAVYILPTDKTWAWAADHLDAEISPRSTAAGPALRAFLKSLKIYLSVSEVTLAEFVRPKPRKKAPLPPAHATAESPAAPRPAEVPPDLETRIRQGYFQESGSAWNEWIKLAALRRRLSTVPRSDLDRELLRLERAGRAVLYPIDNPQVLTAEDREAAIDVFGFKRHIVLLKG